MITLRRWNVLERLDSEERITGFLEAAIGNCYILMRFFSRCLAKAAQARIINQLAKETNIDRKALCGLFLDDADDANDANTEIPEVSQEVISRVAQAFSVPVHV